MSSSTKTTNYQLSQFQNADVPAWLTDYNGDMQKIDAGIHAAKVQADGAASGVSALQTAVSGKQDTLTFDTAPISGSNNPVTSGGIYNALQNVSVQTDAVPTEGSTKAVQSGGVYNALQGKQNTLSFDSVPAAGSSNPVTSAGIYAAIQAGAVCEILTTHPTAANGIQCTAVKIGKLVIVTYSGFYQSGASESIKIDGVTVYNAPTQYGVSINSSNVYQQRTIASSNFESSLGNTYINIGGNQSTSAYQFGTLFFICN